MDVNQSDAVAIRKQAAPANGYRDDLARRVFLEVAIGGHDATGFLEPYLTSFEYTDNAEGKSDEISLELHDRDGEWIERWLPAKGTALTAVIRCLNWWGPGQNLSLDCGKGVCDEVSVFGPPGKISIKAVSASLSGPLRETVRTQGWEAFSLQGVAEDIAARNGLSLYYDADAHPFDRQDQRGESDLAFLRRLAEARGVSLKVRDDRLILYSAKNADARLSPLSFSRTGEGGDAFAASGPRGVVAEYEFKLKSENTGYDACAVDYQDPTSGETRGYVYYPDQPAGTEGTDGTIVAVESVGEEMTNQLKILDIDKRVESEADAMALARNKLREANKGECEGGFLVMGNPGLVAGMTVGMTGFGMFDGKYFVTKTTHCVGDKYTTKAEIRRVLGY